MREKREPPTDVVAEAADMKATKAALRKVIADPSRPRTDPNDAGVRSYVLSAVERESDRLARTLTGGRNALLFLATRNLAELVAAGVLDRETVYNEMRSASEANGYLREHRVSSFEKSFESGFNTGLLSPRDLTGVGTGGITQYTLPAFVPSIKMTKLIDIEGGFWDARESLRCIYIAAMSRMAAPWAVLACCAAKALALTPAGVLLPALVGGPGSLNWFATLAAPSGGGKGAALAVMDELIKSTVYQRNIGSGEGMTEMYRRPASKETGEPAGTHESIMFVADEIDALSAHKSRNASTTLPMLRSAFSGVTLGASTKASGGFHLSAHSYRMTLLVGVQPARSAAILEDRDGGTPQRFQWFPAVDHRIDIECPSFPGELTLPTVMTSDLWRYGGTLGVPQRVEYAIKSARVKSQQGKGDPHESHALFVREKFAYALAVLDGRDRLVDEDWELASVAMKVSDYTREWVMSGQDAAHREEAERHGRELGITYAAADQEKQATTNDAVNRVAQWALSKMEGGAISNRDLQRKLNPRDRPLFQLALERLTNSEMAVCVDKMWHKFDDEPF